MCGREVSASPSCSFIIDGWWRTVSDHFGTELNSAQTIGQRIAVVSLQGLEFALGADQQELTKFAVRADQQELTKLLTIGTACGSLMGIAQR